MRRLSEDTDSGKTPVRDDKKTARDELVRMHAEELAQYSHLWGDEEFRREAQVSSEEAAAGVLEHMGMLYRYTGDRELFNQFVTMPLDRRVTLVTAAAGFLADSPLVAAARRLWNDDLVSEAGFAQIESLFFRRDELCCIVDLMHSLVWSELNRGGYPEVLELFLSVMKTEEELDRVMRQRPELAATAGAPVRALGQLIAIELDLERQWWFSDTPVMAAQADEMAFNKWLGDLIEAQTPWGRFLAMLRRLSQQVAKIPGINSELEPILGSAASGSKIWADVEGNDDLKVEIWSTQEGVGLCLHSEKPRRQRYRIRLSDECEVELDKNNCATLTLAQLESAESLLLETGRGKMIGRLAPATKPKPDED